LTDDNSNAPSGENLVDMDNLDDFEKTFFNKAPAEPEADPEEPEVEETDPEIEDDALATDEDDDSAETEDNDPDEEEEEAPPPPRKGKKSAQERINELTAKAREAERREAALLDRLNKLEARDEVKPTEAPKPLRETLSPEAPRPDALGEDDEPIYPLGEFDPKYIRDLTRFTIAEENKAAKIAAEQEAQQKEIELAQEALKTSWVEKVNEAEKELPDLREALSDMTEAFAGIDPNYGEFLAASIMSCDYGPQIMYYLSQNIGEAQKIVASGPAAATLAIGRLDARFVKPPVKEKRNTKPSEAAAPPEARTRGAGSRFTVAPDTDDLEAFERVYFKK
jgi:hypothetical protein